ESRRALVHHGRCSPARHRNDSRPGRHRHPHRTSLCSACDAAVRRRRHRPRFLRALQYERRGRCLGARHPKGTGGFRLMADLRDLYQEVILEHSKAPRNYRELREADHKAEGFNPLCGDHFTVYLQIEGDSIRDISFQGSGCAISKASASMMTQSLKGKTKKEAEELFRKFHQVVTGKASSNGNATELGKLAVFSGVSECPVRRKCATLGWHTLRAALEARQDAASTE